MMQNWKQAGFLIDVQSYIKSKNGKIDMIPETSKERATVVAAEF